MATYYTMALSEKAAMTETIEREQRESNFLFEQNQQWTRQLRGYSM